MEIARGEPPEIVFDPRAFQRPFYQHMIPIVENDNYFTLISDCPRGSDGVVLS